MNFIISMIALALGIYPSLLLAQGVTSPVPIDTVAEFGQSSMDFSWLFIKMIFAMLVVIALAIVLIRFVIPRLAFGRSKLNRTDLQVIDRIPLDPKKSLYVLQVENRRLLISVSENHIGLVTELKGTDEKED